jgi:hypothetical protein
MTSDEQQQSVWNRQLSARGKVIIFVGLLLFTVSPILSALTASAIARWCGSRLDEANVHPCIILGVDAGGLLYKMFVAGWLAMFTIPLGLILIVAITIQMLSERKRQAPR